jgi:DNA polymerase III epsilon subunit family exonuclease
MIVMAFDTETTGLVSNRSVSDKFLPHIIDFYAVIVDLASGQTHGEFGTLINPGIQLDPEITEITKLTDADLKDAPKWEKVADAIEEFIHSGPAVLAHNAAFDVEMVDIEYARLKRKIDWPPLICTVEQTRHLRSHNINLSDLHELLLGFRFEDAHRAKPDTQATVRCAIEMYKRGML